MDVRTDRQDDILSVLVNGHINGSNAAAFEEAIRAAIEDSDRAVIIDMEKLSYIDSMGLRVFFRGARHLSSRDAKLVVAMSHQNLDVFEIIGFDKIMAIHPSRAEALASLDTCGCSGRWPGRPRAAIR